MIVFKKGDKVRIISLVNSPKVCVSSLSEHREKLISRVLPIESVESDYVAIHDPNGNPLTWYISKYDVKLVDRKEEIPIKVTTFKKGDRVKVISLKRSDSKISIFLKKLRKLVGQTLTVCVVKGQYLGLEDARLSSLIWWVDRHDVEKTI